MPRLLKITLAVSAIAATFAFAAIGAFGVQAFLLVREARSALRDNQKILDHADGVITDLGRTVKIAGGVLNETRDIERDNRADIAKMNSRTLTTLGHVDNLVQSFDRTQKSAGLAIEQTTAALVPVIQQTQKDVADLEPAIQQVTPLLMRSTDIAVNLSNATADVQHEIHKLVYPPPRKWWQKWITDPAKDLIQMFKLTHSVG